MTGTEGPNGCTCGHNGDCNCPFTTGEIAALERCGHGKPPDEWCETCDGNDEVDDRDDEECTCPRSRHDLAEERGLPCDACGRMVR